MNIYEKIQKVKKGLLESNLKKSGENTYAGFKYYELADFLPTLINLCEENKLYTKITFDNELAKLIIKNAEKSEEVEEYTSPMRNLELKGCNQIQALGGVETYQRRYLYMSAFDIVENDMFDANTGKEPDKEKNKNTETKGNNKPIEDILNKKFQSGKHAGKTFLEICSSDMNYIDWLINEKKSDVAKQAKEEYEKSQVTISDEEFEEITK